MIEISDSAMLEVILIVCIVATISGLVKCASVIFEAVGYLEGAGLNAEESQLVKRKQFMPRFRAPMYESFVGEILLVVLFALGITESLGQAILAVMVIIFLVIIFVLARHFYRAGRVENGCGQE
jgi:uncharacterized membrane protein YphA (DoxX/SURF4 family)